MSLSIFSGCRVDHRARQRTRNGPLPRYTPSGLSASRSASVKWNTPADRRVDAKSELALVSPQVGTGHEPRRRLTPGARLHEETRIQKGPIFLGVRGPVCLGSDSKN
jgi:hypothetical protein